MKNKINDNSILLKSWLYKVISENTEIITPENGVVGVYAELQEIFLQDIQLAMKDMAKEIMPLLKKSIPTP